jgi:RNA polymerase sigma-70 factor (ECF subfamily)
MWIMNGNDHGSGRPDGQAISRNSTDAPRAAGRVRADSTPRGMLVADALALLSAEHRAVVLRSYYLGATTAQIAADLRIPEDTVKSRLHFALRDLRHALQAMGLAR